MRYTKLERLTAKKPHKCDNCGGRIDPGDEYIRRCCYEEGRASTSKTHPGCNEPRNEGRLRP